MAFNISKFTGKFMVKIAQTTGTLPVQVAVGDAIYIGTGEYGDSQPEVAATGEVQVGVALVGHG